MAAWKRTVVSILGSVGLGAALAAWRERRRRALRPAAPPAPPSAEATPPPSPSPAPAPVEHPGQGTSADPGAAIDAARERLRREADERARRDQPEG